MEADSRSGRAPVSVVIPCYNCASTIGRALASVAAQTWPPEEIIVVDDASHDGGETARSLEEAAKAHGLQQVRVIHLEENRGPGAARNVGWEAAGRPYVAFLDSDDTWHPMKLAIQLGYMLRSPAVVFSAHRWRVWRGKGETAEQAVRDSNLTTRVLRARSLLLRNVVSTSTVVLRRDIPCRFPERRFSEDYELWLDLLLRGYRGVLIERALAYIHKAPYGEGGLSRGLWSMEKGELETYWRLFRRGQIGWHDLALCAPWSLAKYARRVILSVVRRVGS